MAEFFAMGGYALYVWGAYGLTAIVLLANLVAPALHQRRLKRDFARRVRLAGRSA